MSAAIRIIKSHGGALQLFSQLTQGRSFKIYMRALVDSSQGMKMKVPQASEAWQGSGTTLLVDTLVSG
jgi:hypothetical protein